MQDALVGCRTWLLEVKHQDGARIGELFGDPAGQRIFDVSGDIDRRPISRVDRVAIAVGRGEKLFAIALNPLAVGRQSNDELIVALLVVGLIEQTVRPELDALRIVVIASGNA